MRYTLSAHNNLTGAVTERKLTRPRTQRQWETQVSQLIQSMQDLGDDDFEGYIEIVNDTTGERIHRMNASWVAQ